MSVFTHLSLSPINIAAALCSAKAYNSAYAKGEQMINETMYARGAESSIIREILAMALSARRRSVRKTYLIFAGQSERSGTRCCGGVH